MTANIKFKRPASQGNAPAASVDSLEYGEPGFDPSNGLLYVGRDSASSIKFVKEGADTNYLKASNTIDITTTGNMTAAEFSADVGTAVNDGYGFGSNDKDKIGIQYDDENLILNSIRNVLVNLDADENTTDYIPRFGVHAGDGGSIFLVYEDSNTYLNGGRFQLFSDKGAADDLGDFDNYQLVLRGGAATGDTTGILFSSYSDTYGGSAVVHHDTNLGGKGDLAFYTKQSTAAEPPVEVMRLDDAGNVGIGTNAPAAKLHVSSTGDTVLKLAADSGNTNDAFNPLIHMTQDAEYVNYYIGIEGGATTGSADGTAFTNSLANYAYLKVRDTSTNTAGLGFQIATQPTGQPTLLQ